MNTKTTLLGVAALATAIAAQASAQNAFTAGDLVLSSSYYTGTANLLTPGSSILPNGSNAVANGSYFQVFNNETPDANFGVTTAVTLSEITTSGADIKDIQIPTNILTTSFSSKSELGLNLSTDGTALTFMGYNSAINQFDISNVATDTNHAIANNGSAPLTLRAIGQINADGSMSHTLVDSYSGNNGRAAILAGGNYYTVGNANYVPKAGESPSVNTGVQIVNPGSTNPTKASSSLGSFNVTQYGYAADKVQKDNNFRGVTVFNNTLYVTKGSGGNGIDTVYQVGANGSLPTGTNNAISILPGFSTALASGTNALQHPFGLFFANASTLYVADEGDGVFADATKNATTNGLNYYAGLQKWSLSGGIWHLDYILTNGLNLGQLYSVSGTNADGSAGTYTTATDGLRQLTGKTNADGTVSLYAVTSTANNYTNGSTNCSKDAGADPDKLVAITDLLSATNASDVTGEQFSTLSNAVYGQVLRGISFAPQAVPEPSTWALIVLSGFAAGFVLIRNRRQNS